MEVDADSNLPSILQSFPLMLLLDIKGDMMPFKRFLNKIHFYLSKKQGVGSADIASVFLFWPNGKSSRTEQHNHLNVVALTSCEG
jgi:hypothetical protein